ELANGGTLFLDEIGKIPASLHPKFLRILDECRVRRIGSNSGVPVDVRILAAASDDVIMQSREHIYPRLGSFQIPIPPLRERKEDIYWLAESIIQALNERHGTHVTGLDPDVLSLFNKYDWPGNARELQNVLERAAILAGTGVIQM